MDLRGTCTTLRCPYKRVFVHGTTLYLHHIWVKKTVKIHCILHAKWVKNGYYEARRASKSAYWRPKIAKNTPFLSSTTGFSGVLGQAGGLAQDRKCHFCRSTRGRWHGRSVYMTCTGTGMAGMPVPVCTQKRRNRLVYVPRIHIPLCPDAEFGLPGAHCGQKGTPLLLLTGIF